jgi:hypothetical protein
MMKTTTMLLLLLGSFFGQTSAIFPCRTHCQDVCEEFVEGWGGVTQGRCLTQDNVGTISLVAKDKEEIHLIFFLVRLVEPKRHVQPAPLSTFVVGVV